MSEKRELAKLVKRVQKGDVEAFGLIYDRFFDSVYAYVYRQVNARADAEDIVAGVFLEAFEKIPGFTWRGAGFSAWLFRIARNDVLDHFRKNGSRTMELTLTEIEEAPAPHLVEDLAEKAWDQRELLRAVNLLPDEQRQVILLKLMLNFSNQQVGAVIDKSEGAVKALQHRAINSLRKTLDEVIVQ